jgi:hypothetical protein
MKNADLAVMLAARCRRERGATAIERANALSRRWRIVIQFSTFLASVSL